MHKYLKNLKTLKLRNVYIRTWADIKILQPLNGCGLHALDLRSNKVCDSLGYRDFVLSLFPTLRFLDEIPTKNAAIVDDLSSSEEEE